MSHDHIMLQHPSRSAPRGLAPPWHTRPPAFAPASALAISAVLVGVAVITGPAVAVAFVPAIIAASHDADTRHLPDSWVAATAVLAVVGTVTERGFGSVDLAAGSGLLAGAALLAFHLVSPRVLGFGDVKFAAALGPLLVAGTSVDTFTGVASLVAAWLCVASAGAIVYAVVDRRSSVPFGPAIVVGAALVVTWGGNVR